MDTMIELPAMRPAADAAYSMIGTRSVRAAELAPNTADADTRTVEVVWSAGARVRRATFFGEPYDEEVSVGTMNSTPNITPYHARGSEELVLTLKKIIISVFGLSTRS